MSVSPSSVTAGATVLYITNQSPRTVSLQVAPGARGTGQPLGSSGPIAPLGTARVVVDLGAEGPYSISVAPGSIAPGQVQVAGQRSDSGDVLLYP